MRVSKMNMTLRRIEHRYDGIFSRLTRDDTGFAFCVAAEHSYNGIPKIPDGIYTCQRRMSPHFGYDVFEVLGVPKCTFIEIHIGNYPQIDSDGCILLGAEIFDQQDGSQAITMSRSTFQKFMILQEKVQQFQLTVVS
jgi:hypothetical protein